MKNTIRHGWTSWYEEEISPSPAPTPKPLVTFAPVYFEGEHHHPNFGDRTSLLILRRSMPKKVSFARAYSGWMAGGRREMKELGEGRAFFRWLQRHQLSIQWKDSDLQLNSLFQAPDAPVYDPSDELGKDLSFTLRPVAVSGRKVKLYVQDDHMLSLLNLPYGDEEDFLELITKYVTLRHQWEHWRAPAPYFLDWIKAQGKRPIFQPGQVGMRLPEFV